MTSTATLQAALDVMHNSEPSIGYSIAYPFGVIGPILCIYFMTRQVQPKFPPKAQRFHMGEITLGDNYAGRTLDDLSKDLPAGVQVTMVRKGGQNIVPAGDLVLAPATACWSLPKRRARSPKRPPSWDDGTRPYRQGSLVSRLHSRLRRKGERGRGPARAACRCRPDFRRICCTSGAMTWTSFRRPI